MSEMVERIARAICVASGQDPDFDYDPRGISFGDDIRWKLYVPKARAAIEAMREPTAKQGMAIYLAWDSFGENSSMGPEEAITIYRAAIDEALK